MSLTVLAIDDSSTMRNLISMTLKSAGFEVIVAEGRRRWHRKADNDFSEYHHH